VLNGSGVTDIHHCSEDTMRLRTKLQALAFAIMAGLFVVTAPPAAAGAGWGCNQMFCHSTCTDLKEWCKDVCPPGDTYENPCFECPYASGYEAMVCTP